MLIIIGYDQGIISFEELKDAVVSYKFTNGVDF